MRRGASGRRWRGRRRCTPADPHPHLGAACGVEADGADRAAKASQEIRGWAIATESQCHYTVFPDLGVGCKESGLLFGRKKREADSGGAVLVALSEPATGARVALTQLRRGDKATVCGGDLGHEDACYLKALGLEDDQTLRVCRHGRYCVVEVLGARGPCCRVALDRTLAERVQVSRRSP